MRPPTRLPIATLLLVGLLAAPVAQAQPMMPPPAPGQPGPLRQRVKRMIEQWKQMQIISALNLSPQQSPKFFAVLNKFERQLKVLRRQNHQSMKAVRRMVRGGNYDARKITGHADRILKNQVKIKQVEYQRFKAVQRVLTAQQLAKLVITLPRLEKRIRRMIQRAKRRGGGPFRPNLVGP